MVALNSQFFSYNDFEFPKDEPTTDDFRSYLDLKEKQSDWHYFDESSRWGKLFADAINAIHKGESVGALLDNKTN